MTDTSAGGKGGITEAWQVSYIVIASVPTEESRHFMPTRVAPSYTSKWRNIII